MQQSRKYEYIIFIIYAVLFEWDMYLEMSINQITCPVLRKMCQFSGNWMDWDQEWCKCFGSASWWPRSIGKICRGLKKLFNIICSFFGFALTICFFLIFTQILDNIILKCTQCFVWTFNKIKINIHKNVN